jgi:ribokinase
MSAARPHICVVGSSNIDLTFRAPRLPRPGETLLGSEFQLGYGGKGANQAVMAARLGARVSMLSRVGNDVFGQGMLQNYRAEGIDTTHVRIDSERATGVASIVVDDAASSNCILVVPGANLGLSPRDICEAADVLRSADVVIAQAETPLETTLEAFRIAQAAGVLTIFNPAPACQLPDELLRLCDLCVPNEIEIETLTDQPAATREQAEAAAWMLLRRGARTVIVTLGARGALRVEEGNCDYLPALTVQAVDPTGAGDAFIGTLAVFIGEKHPLHEALRRANAAAGLSVTKLGTQTALPNRAELEAFLT